MNINSKLWNIAFAKGNKIKISLLLIAGKSNVVEFDALHKHPAEPRHNTKWLKVEQYKYIITQRSTYKIY